MRWTCSVTHRLVVAAVAELLWTYWLCVDVVGFRVYLFVFSFRTHTACRKYKAFLTLIVMRQGRGSDVAETVFCL